MNTSVRSTLGALVAAAVLISFVLVADASESYVGLRVPPLPPGHEDVGGYLVNPGAPTEYAVTEVRFGQKRMWWLEKLTSRNAQGEPQWEVAAAIAVPRIPKGYYFLMGLCEKNGVALPEVIAAAKSEDKERLVNIHRAWLINLETHAFESYPTKGLICINEGFGA